ncbi:hypothetical protein [Chitinophaga niabensis]|nr:hypothetical protein [Chitinophaga niabensis]
MEPFSVTINEQSYLVTPYAKGYSISFHVTTENSQIIFELDEEDNLRALTSGDPVDARIISALAEAITKHFA